MVLDFQHVLVKVFDPIDDSVCTNISWAMVIDFHYVLILVCDSIDDSVCISMFWAMVLVFQYVLISHRSFTRFLTTLGPIPRAFKRTKIGQPSGPALS